MADADDLLHVQLLGCVRAFRGSREIELGPALQRALFAVLVTHAGQPVPRSQLIAAVWGDRAPASAVAAVHTYVSGLRRALEPGRAKRSASNLLLSDQAGYLLRIAPEHVDTTLFARQVERARNDCFEASADRAASLLDDALARWHGEALAGVPGPGAERERTRLAELRLSAIELRSEICLHAGDTDRLPEELTGLIRAHPHRERLYELLMLALFHSGRRAEALEAFRDAEVTLTEHLGIEPRASMRALYAQISAEGLPHRSLKPLKSDEAGNWLRRSDPPIAGGGREFALHTEAIRQLESMLTDLDEGRGGGVVWIDGTPGTGKSELLDQTCGLAHKLGFRVGRLAAGDTPFPAAATCDRIALQVSELCRRAPVVLAIDDMQWADETSTLVWYRLAMAAHKLPLLLLSAARPAPPDSPSGRLHDALGGHGRINLRLVELTAEKALSLLEALIGAQAGPKLKRALAGVPATPRCITAFTGHLLAEHGLVRSAGIAELPEAPGSGTLDHVLEAVRQDHQALSPHARYILRRAAALGSEFALSELSAVTGRPPSELLAALEEAATAGLISDSGPLFVFRHSAFHEAYRRGTAASPRLTTEADGGTALARHPIVPARSA